MKPNPPQIVQERGFGYQFEIEVGPPLGTIVPQISRGTSSETWFFAARLTSDLISLLIVLIRSDFLFANATAVTIGRHAPSGGGI